MSFLLALDQGTTSSRALVFDTAGKLHAMAQRELHQYYPAPGLVEHDAQEILDSQLAVADEALTRLGLHGRELAAIGISNQRETCLIWERASGRALGRAIVWPDRRTAESCARLRAAGAEELVTRKTGLLLDPYFSASSCAGCSTRTGFAPRAARGELACGTIDSWLLWHLSGGRVHATDATNAARTALFDIHAQTWDEELLALWRIPRAAAGGHRFLRCARNHRAVRWRSAVTGIAGDQQAALFGQACFTPGMAKCTYGTGCFVLLATGTAAPLAPSAAHHHRPAPRRAHGLRARRQRVHGRRHRAWLRDGLGLIDPPPP